VGHTACTELQFLYSTPIHLLPLCAVETAEIFTACVVHLYPYKTCGLSRLYRALLQVEYSYISTLLCAVRPLQSLSACKLQLLFY